MTKKQLEKFKEVLLEKQKKVSKNLEYLKTIVRESSTKEASGEHSSYSYHMADQGTDAMEREKAFMFFARDEKYLKQLDDAFERIENGTYGVCRVCEKEIGHERLEAVPTTTICYDCKIKES
jgi:RNA polymerase-binding protein DksA